MSKPKPISEVIAKVKNGTKIERGKDFHPFFEEEPHPGCDYCLGQGHIRFDLGPGHPLFGEVFPCPYLPVEHEFFAQSGLSPRERLSMSVDSIEPRENVMEAVEVIKDVIKQGRGFVYLYGGYGLAKTLILKVVVAEWLRGFQKRSLESVDSEEGIKPFRWAEYTFMESIIDKFRGAFDSPNPNRAMTEIAQRYNRTSLLCIDEIGVGVESQFSATKQFFLLDYRYQAAIEQRLNLITIMASNHTPGELPGRLRDRIEDSRCHSIELTGESFRLEAE
jgi:DNA replication protein DnaC